MTPTAANINRLRLLPTDRPGAWTVSFRSANAGCVHQLYANGMLIDATDAPADRCFAAQSLDAPAELAVLACDPAKRWDDHSALLPAAARGDAWVYRARLPQAGANAQPGDVLEIRLDDATGTLPAAAADRRDLWPADLPHVGFGASPFGQGGFGIGGTFASGFGAAAFGLGPMGLGTRLLEVDLPLSQPGRHRVALQTRRGRQLGPAAEAVCDANPPPTAPSNITPLSYDLATNTLSLEVS